MSFRGWRAICKILTFSDGVRFAICNQWGDNFANFMLQVESLGLACTYCVFPT